MPKRSWPFCQTSSDPSEIHDLSTSFSYESLGITWCHPDSCFLSKTCLGIEKMVIFCNQPLFTWIFFCDLDSAFTFYSVFEWVMFVAICQARFGKVLWSVGRGYEWFMNSLRGGWSSSSFAVRLCTFEENFCMAICIVHDILWCCCVVVLFFCGHRVPFPILVPNNLMI